MKLKSTFRERGMLIYANVARCLLCFSIFLVGFSNKAFNQLQGKDNRSEVRFGNSPGNIINGGMIACDGRQIFYVNMDSTTSGLFSANLDGSNIRRLSSSPVNYLNVVDGWLYYNKMSSETDTSAGLFKMRVDGSNEIKLSSDVAHYINVVQHWIYYIKWSNETSICKIDVDGRHAQVIFPGHYECLSTEGDSLYFLDTKTKPGLYKASVNGGKLIKLSSDKIWKPAIYGMWIFYRNDSRLYHLYKIKSSGGNEFSVLNDNAVYDRFIISDGWLYLSDGDTLKRFSLAKKRYENIYWGHVMEMGVVRNVLFFRSTEVDDSGNKFDQTHIIALKSARCSECSIK